jgi:hypothetical protein
VEEWRGGSKLVHGGGRGGLVGGGTLVVDGWPTTTKINFYFSIVFLDFFNS